MDIAATVESDNQRGGGRDESGYSKKQGGGLAFLRPKTGKYADLEVTIA